MASLWCMRTDVIPTGVCQLQESAHEQGDFRCSRVLTPYDNLGVKFQYGILYIIFHWPTLPQSLKDDRSLTPKS
ncbi:hypothetical protein ACKS0A_10554 [Histoplasma ohiense]